MENITIWIAILSMSCGFLLGWMIGLNRGVNLAMGAFKNLVGHVLKPKEEEKNEKV